MNLSWPYIPYILMIVGVLISTTGIIWNDNNSKTKLIEKSNKIEELNNFILSSISGGDSFCYLSIGMIGPGNNRGKLVVVHEGKYPLYDVSMRIVDLDKVDKIKDDLTLKNMALLGKILNLGNLSPRMASMRASINFAGKTELRFNIFTSARNGSTTQFLRMKLINNKWVRATKVERRKNDTEVVVFEKIDGDYPKNQDGNIDWT